MIEELARDRLGFEQLRPGQLRAVEALAGGRDVLAVLPTGGGKSAMSWHVTGSRKFHDNETPVAARRDPGGCSRHAELRAPAALAAVCAPAARRAHQNERR